VSAEYFEEEEFTTQFNGKTFLRIVGLIKPHWKMAAGFIVTIMLVSDTGCLFTYLGKLIIDDGILAQNRQALIDILLLYGVLTIIQAALVFIFIYLVGILGEKVRYDLRKKMFNHLQALVPVLLQQDAGRLDHVARHL
jgi:ATP-binding cassette, subfamily B, bacterial